MERELASARDRLVELHRRLDPDGRSMKSVEELVEQLERENALLREAFTESQVVTEGAEAKDVVIKLPRSIWLRLRAWRASDPDNGRPPAPTESAAEDDERSARIRRDYELARRIIAEDYFGADRQELRDAVKRLYVQAMSAWPEHLPAQDPDLLHAARVVLKDHEITDLEDGGRVYVNARALAQLRDAVRASEPQRSYQGPGVYETSEGRVFEVLGTVGSPRAMGEKTKMVLQDPHDRGILMLESIQEFEKIEEGVPAFAFSRPLEQS